MLFLPLNGFTVGLYVLSNIKYLYRLIHIISPYIDFEINAHAVTQLGFTSDVLAVIIDIYYKCRLFEEHLF